MKKLKKCPSCGKPIYRYAQVCPYCKSETHFSSVDEETPLNSDIPEPAPEEPVGEGGGDATPPAEENGGHHGRLGAYVRHLKEDTEKVRHEYDEKIGSRYSASTIIIGTVIVILSLIVLVFFIAVQMMEKKTFSITSTVDNSLKEVIDSVETELYQSSTIVAKFPDRQRHSMVYLRDGHLHIFDAANLSDSTLDLEKLNAKAIVDYSGSGVLNAYLSTNEKYIIIIASRNAGNTEFGFYRLSTSPENQQLEMLDRGRVVVEKDGYKVSTDARTASYDSNGDRVSGLSSAEWEKVVPKVEKPKKQETVKEKPVEREPSQVSVTEHIKPSVDIVSKPAVPAVPEKITIQPVKTGE